MPLIESFSQKFDEITELHDWLLATIQPFIKGRIFEAYSGNGDLSSRLINNGNILQLNAFSEDNKEYLRQMFLTSTAVRGIHTLNFRSNDIDGRYRHFQNHFSTVLVCDDFEKNIHNDIIVIQSAKRLISDRGRLIVIGRSPVVLFPGSEQDTELLNDYTQNSIFHLLKPDMLVKTWLFNYNGACFISISKRS